MARQRSRKSTNRALKRRNKEFAKRVAHSRAQTAIVEDQGPQPDLQAVYSLLRQNDVDEETLCALDDLLSPFTPLKRAQIVIQAIDSVSNSDKPIRYLGIRMAIRLLYPYWPREGQADAIYHVLYEKKDLVLIAATSFGKSLILQSVSLLRPDSMAIIVIPLNQIGKDQLEVIEKRGGNPCFLSGESNNPATLNRIREGEFTHLFISPELAITQPVINVLQTPSLLRNIRLVAIDEAHLVHHWGDNFRTNYAHLMRLRISLGKRIPWFACSATIPPITIRMLKERCGFPADVTLLRNPVDRPELIWSIGLLPPNGGSKFEALRFLFWPDSRHKYPSTQSPQRIRPCEIPKTIIFFNTRQEAHNAHEAIIQFLRTHPHFQYSKRMCLDMLKVYTRDTPEFDKKSIISKLQILGEECPIRVIFATEALGMGVDMPDIRRVIQYKLTTSDEPSVLWQRGGRACRDHQPGEVILLAEHWTFGSRPSPDKTTQGSSQQEGCPSQSQSQSQQSTVIVDSTQKDGDESGPDEDIEETIRRPTGRAAALKNAKRRANMPHFWYHLINNDSNCIRDAFLHYFDEPARFTTAKQQRHRCCSKCDTALSWGVVSLDNYPHCYLHSEKAPRTCPIGKKVIKAVREWALEKANIRFASARFTPRVEMIIPPAIQKVIEANATLLLSMSNIEKHLNNWRFLKEYGEEFLVAITAVTQTRPKSLSKAQFELHKRVSYPAFETYPQSPSTQAPSLHNFELTNPQACRQFDGENTIPASSLSKQSGTFQHAVRSPKRPRLMDVTNTIR
ncbi:DNA helicase, ATP-dependent, RecQ type [Ascosphaera apis ARSEF 7405]|uniref:DNA 3'-5' helicase n=1 Tax=Ascosphaera apis ARSEF 7405 TaxID=392613 RepID=A0A168C5W4_9EURO|nr:DNA helicase, ATP-dependent, RecQ type [Ascosphaera apis ARSEF 7405]